LSVPLGSPRIFIKTALAEWIKKNNYSVRLHLSSPRGACRCHDEEVKKALLESIHVEWVSPVWCWMIATLSFKVGVFGTDLAYSVAPGPFFNPHDVRLAGAAFI